MTGIWSVKRFDAFEMAAVATFALFVGGVIVYRVAPPTIVAYPPAPEGVELALKYGPDRNSEHEEEWIIRDFFQDRRNGTFVDVGANDYRIASNTYFLETRLGWSGLAIEPQQQFADGYARHRPRSKFVPLFVSDKSDQEVSMYYVPSNPLVTSQEKSWVDRLGAAREMKASTVTIDDLLAREHLDHFDFLSMDIELAEPNALKGFDIDRFRPALVCIEAQPQVRQEILNYFADHQYELIGKYLRIDTANLYFAPAGARVDRAVR
jgi:FkbM family methyltransferase